MTTIKPSDIEFIKEAVMWRDKKREEGVEPHTYRNEDKTHIALLWMIVMMYMYTS